MLKPGEEVELLIEKPASGGRMIARHEGEVVLVSGAIPGERVFARVGRAEKRLAFASTVRVLDASSDRREAAGDPACGGCHYAHIAYPRQLELKVAVVADAFARIGRMPLSSPIRIAPSPEQGYRMRARLQVAGGRVGFFREGSHVLCDAAQTGQLSDTSLRVVEALVASLAAQGVMAVAVELTENVPATERAMAIEVRPGAVPRADVLDDCLKQASIEEEEHGVTGCVVWAQSGKRITSGDPSVSDPLTALAPGRARAGTIRRGAESFFQANRFLVSDLVVAVLDAVPDDGDVVDLYAGVGLFSVVLAASGRRGLTAVEGDPASAADLERNAAPFAGSLRVAVDSVERHLAREPAAASTVIADPPRTGLSADALASIVGLDPPRLVYVSCDPATMARDARRLIDAGFRLDSLAAFDLFPNTPHVESVGVFTR